MRMPEALEALSTDPDADRVFGEPYQTPDGATIVPVSKVRHRRDGSRVTRALGVFVVKDGRAVQTPVSPGEVLGDMRAITSGIEAGQRVVLSPPAKLASGDAVTQPES